MIRFDAENQLHLGDRKLLSARLSLLKIANRHALHRVGRRSDRARELVNQIEGTIDSIWVRDVERHSTERLDVFLRTVHDRVARLGIHTADDMVRDLFTQFGGSIDRGICTKCGRDDAIVCEGNALDRFLFIDVEHRRGGLCLNFLRYLVEGFMGLAEQHASRYSRRVNATLLSREVVIQTATREPSQSCTLPLDGSLESADSDTSECCLVLRIEWPIGGTYEEIDNAILSLPYLVFHELFVHALQGCAAPEPVPKVGNDCAFTEGAVDAVACEILKNEILSNGANLPDDVQPLRGAFQQTISDYHAKRFNFTPPKSRRDSVKAANVILQARWFGREYIFQYLRNAEINCGQPAGWSFGCIITLNLQMTKSQRQTLAREAEFWSETLEPDICKLMNDYLDHLDPAALLDALKDLRCF